MSTSTAMRARAAIRGSRRWAVVSFLAADLFGLAAATLVFALGPAESTPRTLPVAAAALLAVEATVFVVSRPAGAGGACWPSPRRWLVTCVAVVALGEAAHPWGALAVTNGVGDARVSLIVFLVMVVGVLGSAAAAAIDPRLLLAVLALLAPASPFLVVIAARMAGPGGHGSVAVGLIVAVLLGLAGEARWAVGRRARLTH